MSDRGVGGMNYKGTGGEWGGDTYVHHLECEDCFMGLHVFEN